MRTERYTIRELPTGWLNKQTGRVHKTAVAALGWITRGAKLKAQRGTIASFIDWETTSPLGTQIVKAIT